MIWFLAAACSSSSSSSVVRTLSSSTGWLEGSPLLDVCTSDTGNDDPMSFCRMWGDTGSFMGEFDGSVSECLG